MPLGNTLGGFWSGFAALTKQIITPPSLPALYYSNFQEWGRWEARRQRYDFYWAWWNNSVYDSAHLWSGQFKTLYGLYRYTRCNYNPMYRLGEFWATTLWGGRLDVAKIGGRVVQSAIPVLTDDDAVRGAIGQLWRDSRWQTEKTILCRYGSVMGDCGLKVEDDPLAGKVRICPVNPQTVRWIQQDYHGTVIAYELWEPRWDPDYDAKTMNQISPGAGQNTVLYTEKCYLDGRKVVYETYKNNQPYPWNGIAPRWEADYGFVPFVMQPHVQMHSGYFWGASELQNGIHKAMELDDVSSKQHDQIRKASDPKWFLAGVQRPAVDPVVVGTQDSESNTKAGKQELPFLYASLGATAVPMVFPLDNQFVSIEIQNQLAAFEKDYPELRYDSARASGDASAKALREVRKSAEAKVHDRRSSYDDMLCRAQAMALAIGGIRGYDGYPFPAGSYESGALDHGIGERSVFLMDPLDRIEEEQALFTAWQTAKLAGWPDEVLMERFDWTPAEIAAFTAARDAAQQKQLEQAMTLQAAKAPAAPAKEPSTNGASK